MSALYNTRKKNQSTSIDEAIIQGIAPGGGLYVPQKLPSLNLAESLDDFLKMDYPTLCGNVLALFFDEWQRRELIDIARDAYSCSFAGGSCTRYKDASTLHFCELYHGPTFAFKDFALVLLPRLLSAALKKRQSTRRILILTATSGDTGKAALEGFKDVANIDIVVFYPNDGVSPIQAKQMQTQTGENVAVFAIEGNFDDAQTAVKQMFNCKAFGEQLNALSVDLSSANSINIGRLLPQIVYYIDSYLHLLRRGDIAFGEQINVVVPTGNFGDILAAYYAKQMGLPIADLVCASNQNDVLTEFFNSGSYNAARQFYTTMSPSMDILISSNLERLLYHISDQNTDYVDRCMRDLAAQKHYQITPQMQQNLKDFKAYSCTEENTKSAIKTVFDEMHYLIDPHTAVAYNCYTQYRKDNPNDRHTVIMSTASPYKFPNSVCQSLTLGNAEMDDYQLIAKLEEATDCTAPTYLKRLASLKNIHDRVVTIDTMQTAVLDFLRGKFETKIILSK